MANQEIADKVGVSLSTVYKVTSGAKFKKSLLLYRQSLGIQQLNNAAVGAEMAAQILAGFKADPEKVKKMSARDVRDLGTFSNAQLESGVKTLAKEIREAENSVDPELQQARELIARKREAKVVEESKPEESAP